LPTSEAEAAGADNTYNCRVAGKKKKRNDIKKTNNKYYEKEEAVKKSHNNKCWRQSRRRGLLNVAINRLSALDRRGKWL